MVFADSRLSLCNLDRNSTGRRYNLEKSIPVLTVLHSEGPKLNGVLAVLSAIGLQLKEPLHVVVENHRSFGHVKFCKKADKQQQQKNTETTTTSNEHGDNNNKRIWRRCCLFVFTIFTYGKNFCDSLSAFLKWSLLLKGKHLE